MRAVVNAAGVVSEKNDYYPFGLRHANAAYSLNANNRFKFNGKEEQAAGNLALLDYGARMYDNVLGRWTSMDPLAEKYYPFSPYGYVLNNPIRYVDPDGAEVALSGMSVEERLKYEAEIAAQKAESKLFNEMYESLENSNETYRIGFGETAILDGRPVNGQFVPNRDGGGTITFLEGQMPGKMTMNEELFHAYQHDNREGYSSGEFNIEFEAKTAVTALGLDGASGFSNINGMFEFQNRITTNTYGEDFTIITPTNVISAGFLNDYRNAANKYAEYNRNNNFGNSHYKRNTTIAPYSLQKMIIGAYGK